ncbi:MAG: hypothetical protein EA350_14600 [Gemmatimonadales bacterium]|nr:MAG: hypothetical protein EA350_14600 [Gemmatimonadales bacterium]
MARGRGPAIPADLSAVLKHRLHRDPGAAVEQIHRPGICLFHVDVGAFGEPAAPISDQGGTTLLCGEPLYGCVGEPDAPSSDRPDFPTRGEDLRSLHRRLVAGDLAALRECRGVFSLAHLGSDGRELVLASDHLGIRPMYLLLTPEFAIFSSVLRIFSELPGISLTVDPQGLAETATRGYAYGSRTPFREVRRIEAAEAWRVPREGPPVSHRYFRWDVDLGPPTRRPDMPERVASTFRQAVSRRLRDDRKTVAMLSGGLDSRAIVAVLRDLDTEVHTFNFSIAGEQDEIFASAFASAAGTRHRSRPRSRAVDLQGGDWSFLFRDAWASDPSRHDIPRPGMLWSGDGGSVGTGGSSGLSDAVAAHLEAGDLRGAAETYAPSIPVGTLPGGHRRNVEAVGHIASRGVLEELERSEEPDLVRRFLLFLMLNDQRRHLDGHFEEIDAHGVELHLPFFDSAFLKDVLTLPAPRLRKHRFYHELLHHLPKAIMAVPWQTYPGHLPCPVETHGRFPSQWGSEGTRAQTLIEAQARRRRLAWFRAMAVARDLPTGMISRPRLIAAGLAYHARIRDYDYVLDFARQVHQFARLANYREARWAPARNGDSGEGWG